MNRFTNEQIHNSEVNFAMKGLLECLEKNEISLTGGFLSFCEKHPKSRVQNCEDCDKPGPVCTECHDSDKKKLDEHTLRPLKRNPLIAKSISQPTEELLNELGNKEQELKNQKSRCEKKTKWIDQQLKKIETVQMKAKEREEGWEQVLNQVHEARLMSPQFVEDFEKEKKEFEQTIEPKIKEIDLKERKMKSLEEKKSEVKKLEQKLREYQNQIREQEEQERFSELKPKYPKIDEMFQSHESHIIMSFEDQNIDEQLELLSLELSKSTTVTDLDLRPLKISDSGARWLGSALSYNSSLKKLHFGFEKVSLTGEDLILSSLQTNTTLEILHFEGPKPLESVAIWVGSALTPDSCLKTLNFYEKKISDKGTELICGSGQFYSSQDFDLGVNNWMNDLVKLKPSVKIISESENRSSGTELSCSALQSTSAGLLQEFSMSVHPFAQDGLWIGSVLKSNSCLTKLTLDANNISDTEAVGILNALRTNPFLKELDLRINPIGQNIQEQFRQFETQRNGPTMKTNIEFLDSTFQEMVGLK